MHPDLENFQLNFALFCNWVNLRLRHAYWFRDWPPNQEMLWDMRQKIWPPPPRSQAPSLSYLILGIDFLKYTQLCHSSSTSCTFSNQFRVAFYYMFANTAFEAILKWYRFSIPKTSAIFRISCGQCLDQPQCLNMIHVYFYNSFNNM